jgi:GntP family gluconate:H+ symporter
VYLIFLLVAVVGFIVLSTAVLRLHPILALLLAAFGYGILCGRLSLEATVSAVNAGFGGTIGYIGIVILAGSIIGTFLEKSGGAIRIAESILAKTGEKNVPLAIGFVGYVVSIPVFCDSGFVILSPLNRALTWKAKTTLASTAIALSLGLYATHTMVPPTPGPVAAAGTLDADLGLVILIGLFVSLFALGACVIFATRYASRIEIDPADEALLEGEKKKDSADIPTLSRSLLPILLPIVLIVFRSIAELPARPFGEGVFSATAGFLGQPVVALLIGVFLAFLLPKKLDREMLSGGGWVGEAVLAASTIILITGAGGAFGKVLQESGIADAVKEGFSDAGLGIWLPFLIAAALKTVQGSSTVAIITTANIMLPLLSVFQLETEIAKALVVVAIGAGSMVVSHVNDSFFWVVTQLSGMNVRQGYRLQTLGTLFEGTVSIFVIWILSLFLL